MTYTIVWSGEVIRALNRLRREDPDTAKILTGAILGLATDPRSDREQHTGQHEPPTVPAG